MLALWQKGVHQQKEVVFLGRNNGLKKQIICLFPHYVCRYAGMSMLSFQDLTRTLQ